MSDNQDPQPEPASRESAPPEPAPDIEPLSLDPDPGEIPVETITMGEDYPDAPDPGRITLTEEFRGPRDPGATGLTRDTKNDE